MTQRDVSEWAVGWTWFAAVMMWLIGGFHAIAGLVAIIDDEFYVVTRDYIFQFDATAWGWIHLIAGVIVVLAGVYLLSGAVWARIIGVILAVVSILVNFAWLPWSPLWSIIMITANVFVIWRSPSTVAMPRPYEPPKTHQPSIRATQETTPHALSDLGRRPRSAGVRLSGRRMPRP